jgi:Protein of unknown function (DUF3293)
LGAVVFDAVDWRAGDGVPEPGGLEAGAGAVRLNCIDGIGKHPSNNWPGEVSVLVLGLDLEAAKSLARHYEQHAFVWAAGDGVPQLDQP